ncbi:carboxymuconolactone decarboxylase family protein [Streptomyces graminilatus]|uniref:carboxymuconolactone decarboxylase family protein n=1 Tax=Streptomyces graminilatus TaxID=1464070 RepID=UPI0006E1F65A|nr:carboxymuconolactone decarboxylase family protein [Streptomyces graminilatus]
MARIPYPDPDSLPAEAQKALARLASPLNIMAMVSHAHTLLEPVLGLAEALFTRLDLPPEVAELSILQVALDTGAEYEWVQHEPLALRAGVPAEQLAALRAGDTTWLDERQRAAVRVAQWVCRGEDVPASEVEEIREVLTSRQLLELFLLTGCYLQLARIITVLEVDIDPADGRLMKVQADAGA